MAPGEGAGADVRLHARAAPTSLLAQPETFDQLVVAAGILALEVVEQPPPPADELQKSASGVVILRVRLEVVGQVCDAVSQQRDLDLGRARVGVVCPILPRGVRLLGPVISNVL